MKLSKKKVVALALAVCLLATLSLGTLAWFTAEDKVTNNFYVGDTETDADDVFGIDLWENRDTNGDGDYNEAEDAQKAEGLVYEDILPGEVLSKEPHLENTGIHPQFVRAIVAVSDAYTLMEAMEGKWGAVDRFLPGTDAKWTLDQVLFTKNHEFVYIYYYNEPLAAGAVTEALFDAVIIPTGLTLEQAQSIDNFQINILGQAIQSEHLADPATPGAMVTEPKKAFQLYFDAEGTVAGIPEGDILGDSGETIVPPEPVEDNYIVVDSIETITLNDKTVKVNKAVVSIPSEIADGVILISGLTVEGPEGVKIVDREIIEGAGNLYWVYVDTSKPTTVNGVEVTPANYAQYISGVHVDFQSFE